MQQSSSTGMYLTTDELARLIKYDARTIRNRLKDSVLLEGVHYIRPFGRRKILFIRAAIERDIGLYSSGGGGIASAASDAVQHAPAPSAPPVLSHTRQQSNSIPMAAGGVCHV